MTSNCVDMEEQMRPRKFVERVAAPLTQKRPSRETTVEGNKDGTTTAEVQGEAGIGSQGRWVEECPRARSEGRWKVQHSRQQVKAEGNTGGATADMVVAGLASNAVTAVGFSRGSFGDVDLTECLVKLHAAVGRVHRGDLREAESLLTVQAVTLNTIFTHLANLAAKTEYVDHLDRYMRLALKAQGQCRATIETLAEIKNPPTLFAQQANVAHGPQQVNNAVSTLDSREARPTRAANRKNRTKRTIGAS